MRVESGHAQANIRGTKSCAYLLFALAAGIAATAGSDILARMWIGGVPLAAAGVEHLRYGPDPSECDNVPR